MDQTATFDNNIALMGDHGLLCHQSLLQQTPSSQHHAVRGAREEGWSFSRAGKNINSQQAPLTEAKRFATNAGDPRPVLVMGLGGGEKLNQLAARGFTGVALESDPQLAKLVLERVDLSPALTSFKIIIGTSDLIQLELTSLYLDSPPSEVIIADQDMPQLEQVKRYCYGLQQSVPLRILVVGPITGGSLPTARFSYQALRKLGHDVEYFNSDLAADLLKLKNMYRVSSNGVTIDNGLTSLLSQAIELKAQEFAPDLVLALAQAPLLPDSIQRIRKNGIHTSLWFVEDWQTLTWWRQVAGSYNSIFGLQKEPRFVQAITGAGSDYHYLPTCGDSDFFTPEATSEHNVEPYRSKISFLGAAYYNRRRLFRGLLDLPLALYGDDWVKVPELCDHARLAGQRLSPDQCREVFRNSEINLNLHSSIRHEGVDPDGDFVNPRTFELALCGAFQIVDRRQLMEELIPESLLATFSDINELRSNIGYWQRNPAERQQKAERLRSFVQRRHTYLHRMRELVATLISTDQAIQQRIEARAQDKLNSQKVLTQNKDLAAIVDKAGGTSLKQIMDSLGQKERHRLNKTELSLMALAALPIIHRSRS